MTSPRREAEGGGFELLDMDERPLSIRMAEAAGYWKGRISALEEAKAQMPSAAKPLIDSDRERGCVAGWNNCISVMDARLSALLEQARKEARP